MSLFLANILCIIIILFVLKILDVLKVNNSVFVVLFGISFLICVIGCFSYQSEVFSNSYEIESIASEIASSVIFN